MAIVWIIGAALAFIAGLGLLLAALTWVLAQLIEKMAPPIGQFMEVDGSRIHYLDVGSGPPIVMVHGLRGHLGNFTYGIVDRLKDRFRLIVIDRPGAGYSTAGKGYTATLKAQAKIVAGVIDRLQLGRPLVVGHSLGGAIALATGLDYPARVGGLALLSPATQVIDTAPAPFEMLQIESPLLRRLASWTIIFPDAVASQKRTIDVIFGPEKPPADFIRKGLVLLGMRPSHFHGASTDLMATPVDLPGQVARYGELSMPVGVLYGAGDRVLDQGVHGGRLAKQAHDVLFELIDNAGHMIPVTQPDRSAGFIERMAARVGKRDQAAAE